MSFFAFLIIGLIAGWVAGELTRGHGYGLIGNLIIGVVGAVLGGYLFQLLGITTYGYVGSLVMSIIGAILFLGLVRLVKRV